MDLNDRKSITQQEILDIIVVKLKAQDAPGWREDPENQFNSRCVYRNEKGHGCAVGVLLTDEQAAEFDQMANINCTAFSSILYTSPEIVPKVLRRHEPFLTQLQVLHDTSVDAPEGQFYQRFREKLVAWIEEDHKRLKIND